MPQENGEHVGSWYTYDPSVAAAIIFAVIYILISIVSIFQTIRTRAWIWIIMIFACLMETVGYVSRVVSTKNVDKKSPFVVSFVLIILAPVIIAAATYVLFGRIVFYVTPREKQTFKFLWMPPRYLTLIFVLFDLLAFIMQGIGAIKVSTGSSKSAVDSGKTTVLAGLGVQLAAFGFFSVIGLRFNILARHLGEITADTNHIAGHSKRPKSPNWMGLLIAVNTSCALILVRSIYRVVEFATGVDGYVSVHEWTFYCFDALPILPIFLIFAVMPPGNYVPFMGWRVPRKAAAREYQMA